MKKKNLFVGLLLASAAFSLAACTSNPKKPTTTTKEVPVTTEKPAESTDKPAESTSEKPVESTSEKPTESTSEKPVESTVEERELISFSIDSENVKKEYAVGEKIDLTGLVVEAKYDNGDTETVTDYELKVLNGDAEVALDAELAAGTYTISIKVGEMKAKTFEVVCKVEQYKFNFDLTANDYNESLEEPYTAEYTYPSNKTFTLFDNKSLTLSLTTNSDNKQVKFQPGNERTLDDITFTDRFSIHSKYGYMSVTTKVTGKVTVYCTVNGDQRQVIIKDGSTQVAIGDTGWTSAELHKITFDAEAGKTYTINSTKDGSVVYAVFFEGSVDASTRVETDEFDCLPKTNEFDIKDNKFDPANFNATIVAADNYGVTRNVALSDCTVTVKNAAEETVEGVITAAGVYQVTVAYNGKEVTFEITVSDPDAKIESVTVDSTAAIKTFHEGDSFNAEKIEVSAKKGAVDITLTDEDYTVKLFKGENEVTGFDLTGTYEVRVYANDTTVYGSYDVNYYAIKSAELTSLDSMIIKKGATTYDVLAKATYTFDDDTTADATKDIVSALYSDSSCTTPTTIDAFANEGTVYCKLTIKDKSKVVTLTVKELSSTEYSFGDKTGDITKDSYFIGGYDKENSEFTAEFNVQLAGIGGSYATNYSTATADDDSGKTFTKAVLPSGDTKTDGKEYVITSTVDCYVTIYFTMANSKFTTENKPRGGELLINGETIKTVDGSKANDVAYAYTFYVKKNETYKLRSDSNRLAIFEFVVEK